VAGSGRLGSAQTGDLVNESAAIDWLVPTIILLTIAWGVTFAYFGYILAVAAVACGRLDLQSETAVVILSGWGRLTTRP
jgi:hypothetical protein